MEDIFKTDEQSYKQEVKKLSEELKISEDDLENLEMMFIKNKVDQDTYNRMKPKLKEKLDECTYKFSGLKSIEKSYIKYLKKSITLIQNLEEYYTSAPSDLKPKIVGSIFPEKLTIEKSEC
jgi:site-specific DNA recombinase